MGNMKNKSIGLSEILDITMYKEGVGIEKAKGRTPLITFSEGRDIFVKILARIIEEYN